MKKMFFLFVGLSIFLLTTNCDYESQDDHYESQDNEVPGIDQKYDQFQDYFVLNEYPVNANGCYLLLKNYSELSSIFHPAALMQKQNWISAESFAEKVAISVIKNESANIQALRIEKVRLQSGILNITYKTIASDGSYQSRPYLLIMVPGNLFTKVKFNENGKLVKTITK